MRKILILFTFVLCISSAALLAAAGDKHTFEMKWQEHGVSDRVEVSPDREEPFGKEPDFGQREVLRGMLPLGPTDHQEQAGFIWDKSEGMLYVDLNRDGDLTNDPDGTLKTDDPRGGEYRHHDFEAFPISFSTELGNFRYRLSAMMIDYPWSKNAQFTIRSSYGGTVDLYGTPWNIEVCDKLEGRILQGNKMTVDGKDISNSISHLAVPKNVFLDGRCYAMDFEFRQGENDYPVLWCTLTETEIPLGTLRIEGGSVSRLVFGDKDMLVLPPLNEKPVLVPAGDYYLKACSLKYKPDYPGISPQRLHDIPVKVPQEGEGILKVGTPLQNSVRIERTGKLLQFNYELKGIGGETYDAQQINNYDQDKKPTVTIYKGDMQVGSGEFEYG